MPNGWEAVPTETHGMFSIFSGYSLPLACGVINNSRSVEHACAGVEDSESNSDGQNMMGSMKKFPLMRWTGVVRVWLLRHLPAASECCGYCGGTVGCGSASALTGMPSLARLSPGGRVCFKFLCECVRSCRRGGCR